MIVFYITLLHLFITGCSKNIDICNQQINDKNTSKKIDYENKLKQFFNACVLNKNNDEDAVVQSPEDGAPGSFAVPLYDYAPRGSIGAALAAYGTDIKLSASTVDKSRLPYGPFLFRQISNNDKKLISTEESWIEVLKNAFNNRHNLVYFLPILMSKDLKATDGSALYGTSTASDGIPTLDTVLEDPNNNYNQIKRLKESDSLEEFYEIFYNMLISYNQTVNIAGRFDSQVREQIERARSGVTRKLSDICILLYPILVNSEEYIYNVLSDTLKNINIYKIREAGRTIFAKRLLSQPRLISRFEAPSVELPFANAMAATSRFDLLSGSVPLVGKSLVPADQNANRLEDLRNIMNVSLEYYKNEAGMLEGELLRSFSVLVENDESDDKGFLVSNQDTIKQLIEKQIQLISDEQAKIKNDETKRKEYYSYQDKNIINTEIKKIFKDFSKEFQEELNTVIDKIDENYEKDTLKFKKIYNRFKLYYTLPRPYIVDGEVGKMFLQDRLDKIQKTDQMISNNILDGSIQYDSGSFIQKSEVDDETSRLNDPGPSGEKYQSTVDDNQLYTTGVDIWGLQSWKPTLNWRENISSEIKIGNKFDSFPSGYAAIFTFKFLYIKKWLQNKDVELEPSSARLVVIDPQGLSIANENIETQLDELLKKMLIARWVTGVHYPCDVLFGSIISQVIFERFFDFENFSLNISKDFLTSN